MSAPFPILLVDDEPEIADLLQRAASRDFPEAQFHHIQHPEEVLSFLEDTAHDKPRLILLDIDMGRQQTGLDLLHQLRTHPSGRLVPIVMLSANQDRETILASYKQGANVFTQKPYSYNEWKQYVRDLRTHWFNTVTM